MALILASTSNLFSIELSLQHKVKVAKPIFLIWHYIYRSKTSIILIQNHLRYSIRLFKNTDFWFEGVQLLALTSVIPCGGLIANWLARRFEINHRFQASVSMVKSAYEQWMKSIALKTNKLKGFRLEVTGRLGNTEIANRLFTQWGAIPRQTLSAGIILSTAESYTLRGVLGVRVLTHY